MTTSLTNSAPASRMYRLNPRTNRAEPVDANRDEYVLLPPTKEYVLQFTGVSDMFEMPTFDNPDEKEPYFRLEFTIHRSKQWGGAVVSVMWTPKLSDQANLGKFILALRNGTPIGAAETVELTDYLGQYFVGTIVPNQTGKRAKVTNPRYVDAEQLTAWNLAATPNAGKGDADLPDADEVEGDEPELVGVGAASGPNPFTVDDDDDL